MLCGGCGLVLVQNIADLSRESQGYTSEEFMSQARTGPALSLTMHDKGLSTVIGNYLQLLEKMSIQLVVRYQAKQNSLLED
jgi:transcription initiation factor TFIIIB Brf1 subunit/transcription initiation factor TFIIB